MRGRKKKTTKFCVVPLKTAIAMLAGLLVLVTMEGCIPADMGSRSNPKRYATEEIPTDTNLPPNEEEPPPVTPPSTEETRIDYLTASGGRLELPVEGASGYASIPLDVTAEKEDGSEIVGTLTSGQCFRILREDGEKWEIQTEAWTGWVAHRYCFINLPDVIPSIVYHDTNASSSLFVSSGKEIPGITHEQLYQAYSYNERLDREEYIMPVLYAMAPKICAAQQAALADRHTLIIYETFRPREVQKKVVELLTRLASTDSEVNAGITTSPWSTTWFISTGVSNHQKGYAFDVSLGKVNQKVEETIGNYTVSRVTSYTEYTMQTPMHELSIASISMTTPVSTTSDTAWRDVPIAPTMNEPAILLREICTGVGFSPLASEWWHFNDLDTAALVQDSTNIGEYYLDTQRSIAPPQP